MQCFPHDVTVNQLPGRGALPHHILLSRKVFISLLGDYLWRGPLGDNFRCVKHSSASLDRLGSVVHQEVFQGRLPRFWGTYEDGLCHLH